LVLLLTIAPGIQSWAQNLNLNISAQAGYDNTIITSSVDSNGAPNFLVVPSSSLTLPINGGNTCGSQACPLVMMIAGQYQVLNTNISITLPNVTGEYFIYVKQDLTNLALINTDFGSTNLTPVYQYTPPACSTSSSPEIWFDLSTDLMKTCVSSGSFIVQPLIVIGVADVNATPVIDQVLCEPYRLNPYRRVELFGTGVTGAQQLVSGTTTVDGWQQYTVLEVNGGTTILQPTGWTVTNPSVGLIIFSQNPVLIINGASVNANGKGAPGGAGGAAGAFGSAGSAGGCAAGGGGGGYTSASNMNGGNGGSRVSWGALSTPIGGGAGGTSSSHTGGIGQAETTQGSPDAREIMALACIGGGGGGGAGDSTHGGGAGAAGGGAIIIRAPSILVDSTSLVTAGGTRGSNGTGGGTSTAAGGGGGGGGTALLQGIFVTVSAGGRLQAGGGGAGSGASGGGNNGGSGGAGLFLAVQLQ
jgi:hypothetical protein